MKNRRLTLSSGPLRRCPLRAALIALTVLPLTVAAAESTNSVALSQPLPNVGASMLRVFGALAVVLGVFLAGVWLYRNWQRLFVPRGRAPRLNVLESRSLGGRHALYVVGYEGERFLLAASPSGVNLLSPLQPTEEEIPDLKSDLQPSFAQSLTRMLKGK